MQLLQYSDYYSDFFKFKLAASTVLYYTSNAGLQAYNLQRTKDMGSAVQNVQLRTWALLCNLFN